MAPEGPNHRRVFSIRLLIGLWIIANGLILFASNLGWIDARPFMRYLWPLIFVFLGVGILTQSDQRKGRRAGWVFIFIGLWMMWDVFLPALLLCVGGMLVRRAFLAPSISGDGDNHAEFVRSFAVMSGTELRPVSRPFRGADLSAVMAGIKLDLTDARMEGDVATIEVFAFWGGMEIHVPPDWTVSSRVSTFMGGFSDKRRPTVAVPTKTLIIDGVVVMSGIEIKN